MELIREVIEIMGVIASTATTAGFVLWVAIKERIYFRREEEAC